MLRWTVIPVGLVLLSTACPAQIPTFSKNRVEVRADPFEYSQILFYNYTTQEPYFEEAENGDNGLERPIQTSGWVSFWLYDYDAGRYTESVLVGHKIY